MKCSLISTGNSDSHYFSFFSHLVNCLCPEFQRATSPSIKPWLLCRLSLCTVIPLPAHFCSVGICMHGIWGLCAQDPPFSNEYCVRQYLKNSYSWEWFVLHYIQTAPRWDREKIKKIDYEVMYPLKNRMMTSVRTDSITTDFISA